MALPVKKVSGPEASHFVSTANKCYQDYGLNYGGIVLQLHTKTTHCRNRTSIKDLVGDKSLRIEKQTINKELDVMYNVTNEVVSAKASYAEFEKLLCQPVPPNVAFYAYITGIATPYGFIGGKQSIFAAHVEAACLPGYSYCFHGAKKWYVVNLNHTQRFKDALQAFLIKVGRTDEAACQGLLHHKTYLPTEAWLRVNGIDFHAHLQKPGEVVLVFQNAVHFGINEEMSVNEAMNFGTSSYFNYTLPDPPQRQCLRCPFSRSLPWVSAAKHLKVPGSDPPAVAQKDIKELVKFVARKVNNGGKVTKYKLVNLIEQYLLEVNGVTVSLQRNFLDNKPDLMRPLLRFLKPK